MELLTNSELQENNFDFAKTSYAAKMLYLLRGEKSVERMELARRLGEHGVKVKTQEDLGLNSDAKEAVAFALMGDRFMAGLPNTLPSVTGAAHAAVMGKPSLPFSAR